MKGLLTLGVLVRYTTPAPDAPEAALFPHDRRYEPVPAIVAGIDDGMEGLVSLVVFAPGSGAVAVRRVPFVRDPKTLGEAAGKWQWPPD